MDFLGLTTQCPFINNPLTTVNQGGKPQMMPPMENDFLLLDGTNFLLLDGTNFLLL